MDHTEPPLIELLAARLQGLLVELFSERLPVVRASRATTPAIAVSGSSAGDPYGGYTSAASVTVGGLALNQEPVRIEFGFSVHELSGQCDDWRAVVSGVPESTRERFHRLFHPEQYTGWWSPHAPRTFQFNGATSDY